MDSLVKEGRKGCAKHLFASGEEVDSRSSFVDFVLPFATHLTRKSPPPYRDQQEGLPHRQGRR
jgi:hypothetical protein